MGKDRAVGICKLRCLTAWVLLWSRVPLWSLSCLQREEYCGARVISLVLYLSQAAGPCGASVVSVFMVLRSRMCRWKRLQQWVHQSSGLTCCKRPTPLSRLLWSRLPCTVRHAPHAHILILCTSCVFPDNADDCMHHPCTMSPCTCFLEHYESAYYTAKCAKVLPPRLSSFRLAAHTSCCQQACMSFGNFWHI